MKNFNENEIKNFKKKIKKEGFVYSGKGSSYRDNWVTYDNKKTSVRCLIYSLINNEYKVIKVK